MLECQSYIKDHKEDFPHKISCRFIKSSKSDIGKISKITNFKINKTLITLAFVNQW